jgi:alpha-glucosidase
MSVHWWRNAVIYQIYPKSFLDTDGDGVGNIAGVTARLDHLAGLGVDAVWLSPFYPSPWADGGYDVADYRDVDPMLGTLDDFDALIAAAHDQDIRVMIDIVPNHVSHRHPWFQQALAAPPGSAERDRFVFRDGRGDGSEPPTNWLSRFGGPAWTRVPDGQWYLHLYAPEQPDLDWRRPEVRDEFLDVLRFWADRGVDGFRIDVAHALVKDLDEPLRDVVALPLASAMDDIAAMPDHPHWDRPEVHEIYRDWRRLFEEYDPPRTAVAEAWLPSARRVRYTRPGELQQAFNFEFLYTPWDAHRLRTVITDSLADAHEVGTVPTWVLSNHDVVRTVSRLGLPTGTDLQAWLRSDGHDPEPDLELGTKRARAAALLQLALPGSTYLYQGEELGLPEVADLSADALQDPKFLRSHGAAKGRDGCRVPLPWDDTSPPAYGFSSTSPWLPQPQQWADLSVAAQTADPDSVLELYRTAIRLRRELPLGEELQWVDTEHPATSLAFRRGNAMLVVTNFDGPPIELPEAEVLLTSGPLHGHKLPADTTVWLAAEGTGT